MANYPETIKPLIPYTCKDSYSTIKSGPYENGRVVTRAARLFPVYSVSLRYPPIDSSNYDSLIDFFVTLKGGNGTFTFTDFIGWDATPVGKRWPKLYVGVGDSTNGTNGTATWDVPMKNSSSISVYVNGTLKTVTTHYTTGSGTGADGRDRITFTAGNVPTTGQIIEYQATGRRCINARLGTDDLSLENVVAMLVSTGLDIVEAR